MNVSFGCTLILFFKKEPNIEAFNILFKVSAIEDLDPSIYREIVTVLSKSSLGFLNYIRQIISNLFIKRICKEKFPRRIRFFKKLIHFFFLFNPFFILMNPKYLLWTNH